MNKLSNQIGIQTKRELWKEESKMAESQLNGQHPYASDEYKSNSPKIESYICKNGQDKRHS